MADHNPAQKLRVNVDIQGSSHDGLSGFYEVFLRRFKFVGHVMILVPLYALASICLGLSLAPALALYNFVSAATASWPFWFQYPALGISVGVGYFLYGFTLILVVPAANALMTAYLKPWRGPYYSVGAMRWYIHNALTYVARYTFLEFVTPTPFNIMFYRLMGMRIGRGTQLNSTHISDPSLITIGENVTIGGSATIVGHYGVGGFLVMAPVTIGNGATVGLKATIMGGVTIGENVKVLPNSVVLPKTKIPSGETWGGVPAQKIEIAKLKRTKEVA